MGFDRYTVIKFGPRIAIERFFENVEWRIRKFWIEAFAGFKNLHKDEV